MAASLWGGACACAGTGRATGPGVVGIEFGDELRLPAPMAARTVTRACRARRWPIETAVYGRRSRQTVNRDGGPGSDNGRQAGRQAASSSARAGPSHQVERAATALERPAWS